MSGFTLYVGHGSRAADGNREFLEFVEALQANAGLDNVESCFLELASPTISQGITACVGRGAKRIVVVPVILLAASHVKLEIPEMIDVGRQRYPDVEFVYGRNIGLHEGMIDLLVSRYERARADAAGALDEDTAIVLMGRGSSDPDANGDLYKIGRQLWERTEVKTVEVCFTGITYPRVPDGIRRALLLGARRIVVVPYFLFTGVLIKRMKEVILGIASEHPDVSILVAEYFGMHPRLQEIVLDRVREADAGEARMNCDLCQYRKMAGHDHGHDHGISAQKVLR